MKKGKFIALCVVVFILALAVGVVSKGIEPAWPSKYSVKMTEEIGTKMTDIAYGSGDANNSICICQKIIAGKIMVYKI